MPELIWSKDDDPTLLKTVWMRIGIHPPMVGHVQEVYEVDYPLEWGDLKYFLIVKADITHAQYNKIIPERSLKVKLLQSDGGFLSEESLDKYKRNIKIAKADFSLKAVQPKFDVKMDFADTQKTMVCTAPKAWQNIINDVIPKEV